MIKCHLGSEGCKAESAVVNEPRHPSQLLPRLCSLARNKSHSRRYAVDCYSFGGKKFLYYYHCEQIAFFLIISTLIYPSNVSSCSYIWSNFYSLANLCVPIPRGASIQRMIQPIDSSPPKKKKKEKSIDHRGNLSSSRSFHAKKWRMFEKSRRKRDASRRFHDRCHLPRKLRPSVTLTNLLRYTRQRNSVTGTATPLRSANFVYPHRSIECFTGTTS